MAKKRKFELNTDSKREKKKKWFIPALIIFGIVLLIAIITCILLLFSGGTESPDPMLRMEIISYPEKMEYYVGEDESYYGLKILVTYKDGTQETIDHTKCEITGFDNSTPNDFNNIYVKYMGETIAFSVKILEDPSVLHPINAKFNGLSIKTLPKTEYKVGELLSVGGGVLIKHYDDGSTREIALDYKHLDYDFNTNEPGTYTIKVYLIEDGFYAVVRYEITVTE